MSDSQSKYLELTNKDQFRRHFRALRKQLSDQQQKTAANALATRFIQSGLFRDAQNIAVYLANDGEIDTIGLIHACWDAGKRVFLPVLHPFCAGHLLFFEYTPTTTLVCNRYQIFEPRLDVRHVCPLDKLDIIMMPLVCFDEMGNRLGMGKGYYDRTLACFEQHKGKLVGLAHDCQRTINLPADPWDIPLSAIMTPTQII